MGLFVDPVTLNDGTVDHVLTFRAQIADKKAIIGEWVEPGATIASESKITVKQDASSPLAKRRLLQRTIKSQVADLSWKPITVNLTVTHHPEHTEAVITAQIKLLIDALNEVNFVKNFLMGLI